MRVYTLWPERTLAKSRFNVATHMRDTFAWCQHISKLISTILWLHFRAENSLTLSFSATYAFSPKEHPLEVVVRTIGTLPQDAELALFEALDAGDLLEQTFGSG